MSATHDWPEVASSLVQALKPLRGGTPETMAATIYQALGIPRTAHWQDLSGRPHFVYHGDPIAGLT